MGDDGDDIDVDVDVDIDDDDDDAPAPRDDAEHDVSATLNVTGPVSLRLDTLAADVDVVAGPAGRAVVRGEDVDVRELRLVDRGGGRLELTADGRPFLRTGHLRVELPAGSRVEINSTSGDLSVAGLGGPARLRSTSGEVRVRRAGDLQVTSVSGDVKLDEITGEVRLRTVSGDVNLRATSATARLEHTSVSGDLVFAGRCAAGCRIDVRTTSGDVVLALDPSSSFDLRYLSHSGDLNDQLGLARGPRLAGPPGGGESVRARGGSGDGSIDCSTFSGDLLVKRR